MRVFLSFILLSLLLSGVCQTSQSAYLEAKRQFGLDNFAAAQISFKNLTSDPVFGAYASFFYALSSYRKGDIATAYDMWRQLQVNHPSWDKQQEVTFWLTTSAFELKKYNAALQFAAQLPSELRETSLQYHLSGMPLSELKAIYELDPDNEVLARFVADRILSQPYSERDLQLLADLSDKFDTGITESTDLPVVKKEKYAVAVVLPFMFESLENPQPVLRNSIIWDLFQGMQVAAADLQELDIDLELFPYDTRKKGDVAQKLISEGRLENADLIVGPLYNDPHRVISGYSADRQITMINPLSSSGTTIGNNDFAYLFRPSYATQGRVASQYARAAFKSNKKAYVFFESERDSLLAGAYFRELVKDSFEVARFERIDNESAQQIQKDFTEKFEVRLDTTYSKAELDSIRLLPGRVVKSRPLRSKRTGEIVLTNEGDEVTEYYEERFLEEPNTVGHMMVATSSNLLANNFISLAEVRKDTIGIIGYRNWLEFPTISFNQIERLGITFISPGLFKEDSTYYPQIEAHFLKIIGREPGEYHKIGYELIYQVGLLMKAHGKYLQRGFLNNELLPGRLMHGLQFGTFHDNQVVPITKLEDLKLVIQENKMDQKE